MCVCECVCVGGGGMCCVGLCACIWVDTHSGVGRCVAWAGGSMYCVGRWVDVLRGQVGQCVAWAGGSILRWLYTSPQDEGL